MCLQLFQVCPEELGGLLWTENSSSDVTSKIITLVNGLFHVLNTNVSTGFVNLFLVSKATEYLTTGDCERVLSASFYCLALRTVLNSPSMY